MDFRNSLRYPLQCPITFAGGHIHGEGYILDISKDGWKVVSHQAVPKGACLSLWLSLPVGSLPMVTRHYTPLEVDLAIVRWSQEGEFGLEFLRMDTKEWRRLRHFVDTLQQVSSAAEAIASCEE